ncbi:MAG: hypothetical protein ABI748_06980 [Dokdonella sp.]
MRGLLAEDRNAFRRDVSFDFFRCTLERDQERVNQPRTGAFATSGNFVIYGVKLELVKHGNETNPTEASNVAGKLIGDGKISLVR